MSCAACPVRKVSGALVDLQSKELSLGCASGLTQEALAILICNWILHSCHVTMELIMSKMRFGLGYLVEATTIDMFSSRESEIGEEGQ